MLISANRQLELDSEFCVGTFVDEFKPEDSEKLVKVFRELGRKLRTFEISIHSLKEQVGEIDNSQHFGYAAFGRLALQLQIPEKHLYSDVDVLIHQFNLSTIVGYVESEKIGFVSQAEAYALIGIECPEENNEFFAGLILWPHASARPRSTFQLTQKWKTPYSSHDQALLNLKIGQDYQRLDPHLCQLDNPMLGSSEYEPGIVHYFGNWKPWQATGLSRTRCESKNCSWTLWFKAEEDAEKLLKSLGLGPWFRELRNVSLRGAPKNLRILRRVLLAGRLTGTFFIVEWLVRSLWKGEKHLIH